MKKIVIFAFMLVCVSVLAGCGTGDRSPSACVATTGCCGGTGYSNDSGSSCYSNSTCTTACTSSCVATTSCCGGTGYSNDGGTTCFMNSDCASGCGGTTITVLKITNTNLSAVTIGFVTAAYGGACPEGELLTAEELSDAGWCADYEAGVGGAGKCRKTLGAAGSTTGSVFVPNPDNKCISGSFGIGGYAACQTTTYPNGWTQGEFTINPKSTTQEAVDISAVNGVNYSLLIYLPDSDWAYEDGSSIENMTVGPNNVLDDNIGVKGVYPPNCTDCIQLIGDVTCSDLTPDPPTCNSSRICNVYRNNSPGGTVEFKIGELY